MAPKSDKDGKKGKGKKGPEENDPLSEVDRTFFELQLADCNRKLARLRQSIEEYEVKNEELQKDYDKLDEDRADIITFLKKTLNQKTEENTELKDKVKGLEDTREIETRQFTERITELEKDFNVMREQLTAENKMLAGKLNSLEEFRAIRDDLMKKFEKQEQDFVDQELKYKRQIYDAEKKFVIGKDKLKKEMEARLLQLAQDFQDATELRIAASTHRVIRENIAINNELDSILSTQSKLATQNENYKERESAARMALAVAEQERDKAIDKNVIQLRVIERLTSSYQEIQKQTAINERKTYDFENMQDKIDKLVKENDKLSQQIRILEQNLHASHCLKSEATLKSHLDERFIEELKTIINQANLAVRAVLKLDSVSDRDISQEIISRQSLLQHLLQILTIGRQTDHKESTLTLTSFSDVYEKGDLGFIPKLGLVRQQAQQHSIGVSIADIQEVIPVEPAEGTKSESSEAISVSTVPSMKIVPLSSVEKLIEASEETIFSSVVTEVEEEEVQEGALDYQSQMILKALSMKSSLKMDTEKVSSEEEADRPSKGGSHRSESVSSKAEKSSEKTSASGEHKSE